MLFSLLGPLRVVDGHRNIRLDAPKQRALLALLLIHRGEPASVETLAEQLWAGEPPATGTKAVRVYVGPRTRSNQGRQPVVVRVSEGGFRWGDAAIGAAAASGAAVALVGLSMFRGQLRKEER